MKSLRNFTKLGIIALFLASDFAFAQDAATLQKMLKSQNQTTYSATKTVTQQKAEMENEVMSSVVSKSRIGQQANDTPDAQLAMSESSYPVTAGDVYTLAFAAGATPVSYSIPVDSTYKIRIANLGVIDCKNLTYLQLKNMVTGIVQKNYPMGGVQFVLTSPATFRVTITGEVVKTVQKNAWALTRLSTFIKESFTDYSSSRNIKIVSESGEEKTYDLFLADRKGDLSQDPYLRPGDKIVVNRITRRVALNGAVERPGVYELLDGENLKKLIDYYGNGFESLADLSRIELYRSVTGNHDSGEKLYLNEQSYVDDFKLICYDEITISTFEDLKPVVFVEGAVTNTNINTVTDTNANTNLVASTKIAMRFNNGEDYAFFVRNNKDMFTDVSDLENAYILRGSETIPVDLSKMLYDATYYSKIEIKYNDRLIVPFKQFFVTVSGAVYSPGRYPYIPDRTWDYYVGLAGGFIKEKNTMDAVTIIDLNGKKHKKTEFILPEMTIDAKANSGLYYFNQYAPVITTILSAVSTSISVLAVTGVIN